MRHRAEVLVRHKAGVLVRHQAGGVSEVPNMDITVVSGVQEERIN